MFHVLLHLWDSSENIATKDQTADKSTSDLTKVSP